MTTTNSAPSDAPAKYTVPTKKFVMAVTGGGSGAISEILSRGGASSWFVEGRIPYSKEALVDYLWGTEPEKFVSEDTANQMALRSFLRAVELGVSPTQAVGVGVTAVLGKPAGERAGREHMAYMTAQGEKACLIWHIPINGIGDRVAEEAYLAKTIQDNILTPYDYFNPTFTNGFHDDIGVMSLLLSKTRDYRVITKPENYILEKNVVIYAGSFNPFHAGHADVVRKVHEQVGKPIYLEISVTNVDKAPVNVPSLTRRYIKIQEELVKYNMHNIVKGIIVSNTPKFADKFWQFGPDADFVMGSDTASRLINPKYGNPEDAFSISGTYGNNIFVVNRPGYEFIPPKKYAGEFTFLNGVGPDISSTRIRKEERYGS